MDFYKVPIGFGLALAANEPAMQAYSAMSETEKQTIINKAHNVRSEKEMHNLVASLANNMQGLLQNLCFAAVLFLCPDAGFGFV